MIIPGLEGCTRISMDQIRKMDKEIRSGKRNPFEVKSILAKEVTRICHNDKAAEAAEKEFNRVFREKEVPSNIKEVKIKEKSQRLIDLLAQTKIVSSKNEGRRIISQRGVKVDGVVKTNWEESIPIKLSLIHILSFRSTERSVCNSSEGRCGYYFWLRARLFEDQLDPRFSASGTGS